MRSYATNVNRHNQLHRLAFAAALAVLVTSCSPSSNDTATIVDEATESTVTVSESATSTTAPPSQAAPSSTSSTTTTPSTTSSTTTTTRVTTTTAPTTTTTIPAGNEPPTVEITAPAALSAHTAAYDSAQQDFGAYLSLSAQASDPNGDPVEIQWSASTMGALGTGASITAWFSTRGSDATQPVITATAVDQWGTSTSASVQVIVWIPSDT